MKAHDQAQKIHELVGATIEQLNETRELLAAQVQATDLDQLPDEHYVKTLAPWVSGKERDRVGHYGWALQMDSRSQILVCWEAPDDDMPKVEYIDRAKLDFLS